MKESTESLPITKLAMLPTEKLVAVQDVLVKFFLTAGVNINLLNALERKETQAFKQKVAQALNYQILQFAQFDRIALLIHSLNKQEISSTIVDSVNKDWLPFNQSIPGGKATILLFLLFAANQGGQASLDKMVPQFKFNLTNSKIKDDLTTRAQALGAMLDKTSVDWVANTIADSLEQNLTAAQIVKLLRQEAVNMAKERSQLISESELALTMGSLELTTFEKNGIEQVAWKTAADERVDEICLVNEAAGPINLGTEFPMGRTHPPQHLRCRCYLLPVLPYTLEGGVWVGD